MVAVPTSKLRFAWASCWSMATFCASERATLSLREQHVEVGLGDAQPQVLLGLGESGFGLQHQLLRLGDRDPVLHAEDRLRQRDAVGLVRVVEAGRPRAVEPVARDARVAGDERKVSGACLGQALDARQVLGARRLVDGVAHQGVAVDREQVRAQGGAGGEGRGEREGEAGEFHREGSLSAGRAVQLALTRRARPADSPRSGNAAAGARSPGASGGFRRAPRAGRMRRSRGARASPS